MNRLGQVLNYECKSFSHILKYDATSKKKEKNSDNNLNFLVYGDSDTILAATQNGQAQDEEFFSQLWNDLDTIYYDLQDSDLDELNTTVSFGELLDQEFIALVAANYSTADGTLVNAIYQAYLKDQLSNYACPSFYNLSAQWVAYDDNYDGQENVNLKDGYGTLIQYLANALDSTTQIKLSEVVVNIDWSKADQANGSIVVQTINYLGEIMNYTARQVVTSVSLNVLKNNPFLFTPELPAYKRDSINNLTMGTTNKLFFVFDAPVFRPDENDTAVSFLWENTTAAFSLDADKTCSLNVRLILLKHFCDNKILKLVKTCQPKS